ncbi:MAG: hypothetical protein EOM63_00125 [Clostridia bacterium]|nr:hypothetical protein [Clostridia bacterium]
MKKKILFAVVCLLFVITSWMVATGFSVQTSAYITDDFTVAEDGSEITFHTGVGSSMGFIRGYKDEGGGINPHYLKFYSAWGGLNSSLGAKTEYTLRLSAEDTEIYVYHGDSGYALSLKKDETSGTWYRVR